MEGTCVVCSQPATCPGGMHCDDHMDDCTCEASEGMEEGTSEES